MHQSNLHMKRKLREWRTQKCNLCFGAESPPLSTGQQTTQFHAAPYGTVSANLRKVGASFRRPTVFAPIQSTYGREATGMENPKMQSLFWCRKPTSQYAPANYPVSCSAVWDRRCKFAESRDFLSPRYRVCTNPIYIWKGSYGNGKAKNAILVLVQKAHLAVRACKLPGFMQRRMGPSVQICGKSGLSFAEVPCLHQSNLHIKRKLREWRTQKCNPCFGAESPPRSTRLQTTRFHTAPYWTVSANLRKVGASFRRGTVFAPIQSTYEKEATGMENSKMQSLFWCRKPTS